MKLTCTESKRNLHAFGGSPPGLVSARTLTDPYSCMWTHITKEADMGVGGGGRQRGRGSTWPRAVQGTSRIRNGFDKNEVFWREFRS